MSHCVGVYKGTVAIHRDLTRITVIDIKSEWMSHHSSRNNIRKIDTGLTGTMPVIFSNIIAGSVMSNPFRYDVTNGYSC